MSEFLSSQELLNLEQELREASQAVYVKKKSNEGLSQSLKSLSLRTGWATYLWLEEKGLMNIKSSEPPAPKTKEFKEAIKFALDRKHFSVFVFPINTKKSWLEAKLYFSKMSSEITGVVKLMFILPKDSSHQYLEKHAKMISFNMGLDGNYVLRDAKWVSANDLQ